MNVFIDNKELERLYLTGKSRKLRLPQHVADKFLATVQKFEAAVSLADILADTGLHFEKLHGTKKRYSVRLSGKYRLEMEVDWENLDCSTGTFFMKTISKHYND